MSNSLYMTEEQYFALDEATDGNYEFYNGYVVMLSPPSSAYDEHPIIDMAGGSIAHLVVEQTTLEIFLFVCFSLNSKATFFKFSLSKLLLCFFGKSVQSRLHMRLSKQRIPFLFFFIRPIITNFW